MLIQEIGERQSRKKRKLRTLNPDSDVIGNSSCEEQNFEVARPCANKRRTPNS